MKARAVMPIIALVMTLSGQVWACGGDDLTDAEVTSSSQIVKVLAAVDEHATEPFAVEKIVRAGNKILDLDGNEKAHAMCAANYTHVYFKNKNGSRCLTILDVRSQKRIADTVLGVDCITADKQKKLNLNIVVK